MRKCRWGCGRSTKNKTGIDDRCWRDRENIYQARKAKEAEAAKNPKRVAAGRKGATPKHDEFKPHLPATELLERETA